MSFEISPLDGRYREKLEHLSTYFSEFALMRSRCQVELLWVEALDKTGLFPELTSQEKSRVAAARNSFEEGDYRRIKEIEGDVKHDVKACELFLRENLGLDNPNLIHFGLTSEDINNLAYSLLLRDYVRDEQLPQLKRLIEKLCSHAEAWQEIPFPAHTHGQPASPTTAGKEVSVFIHRILRQYRTLREFEFTGKLNGATGNLSALLAAFPDFDWLELSRQFVERLGLGPNAVTTQIEDHDTWAAYFNLTRQINNIMIDLDRDFWSYISLGYMKEVPASGEVGSSTMPHKVNPINFENSEGNSEISNSLLLLLSDKLCRSRMQRDLSDSTVERNIGVALGHSYLAIEETMAGLRKVDVDRAKCSEDVRNHPELLTEPIQTILRAEGVADPYGLLKELSRGRKLDISELNEFIDRLDVGDEVKDRLRSLDVGDYTGDAARICRLVLAAAERELES
jgi:adenylosuccinate lyase